MICLSKGIGGWLLAALMVSGLSQALGGELFLYRGKPQTKLEAMWDHLYSPAEQASLISVQADYLGEKVSAGKGYVLEYTFVFTAGDEFGQAWFKQNGIKLGSKKGIDIETQLNVQPGEKVYLKFRAMRKANSEAVVGFRTGGLAVGQARDSVFPAATPKEKFIKLSVDWKEYSIDLTGEKLDQVVSPFSVVLQSNDHDLPKEGQKTRVVFYVTDIRYVTEPKAAK